MKAGVTWLREFDEMPLKDKITKLKGEIAKAETRQQKWKRLSPEKVRAAQAALMRKRRAK